MENTLLMAAVVIIHPLIVAYHAVFDDIFILYEKRLKRFFTTTASGLK